MKKQAIRALLIIIIILVGMLLTCSCSKQTCPTYNSNSKAKKQASIERKGGYTTMCVYSQSIVNKNKNKLISYSDYCKSKQRKNNK